MIRHYKHGMYNDALRVITAINEGVTDEFGEHPAAEISYRKGSIRPNFETSSLTGGYQTSTAWREHTNQSYYEPDEFIKQPTTLFHVTPPHVDTLFADKSMRAHVAPLLGHVLNHAQMMGAKVEASGSLSAHSSPLVKEGIKAGLVVGDRNNPEGRITNEIGETPATVYQFTKRPTYSASMGVEDLPEQELTDMRRAGREAVVKARGKKRKKASTPKPPPQGEQLSFDI